VQVWDVETGAVIQRLEGHNWPISSVQFSADGTRLLSVSDTQVRRDQRAEMRSLKQPIGSEWILWDLAANRPIPVARGEAAGPHAARIAPHGAILVVAGDDGILRWFRTSDGNLIELSSSHEVDVSHVVCSPDGRYAASASDDGVVHLWAIPKPSAKQQH
jgi:WD40 repeat protein